MLSIFKNSNRTGFQQNLQYISIRNQCGEDARSLLKGLVIGVYQKEGERGPKLTPSGEKFDARVNGKITELIKECMITGDLGKGKIFNNIDHEYRSLAVVGVGREGAGYNELEALDQGMENVRIACGVGAKSLQHEGCTEVHLDSMEYPEQAAEGATLAVWRFSENLSKNNQDIVPKLDMYDSSEIDTWTRGLFKAEAQNLARRLSEAPSNQMTPTIFAQAASDVLCPCGITVEIRTLEWMEFEQLNSLLIIAKGSCEPPLMLEIGYCGTDPAEKPVLLLGKGITFNSGGLNLRKCDMMHEYRGSMSGAAVVVSAIRAAAALSLPINIMGIVPLCENMPSGMSCRPGDIVTLLNKKTMAIRDLELAGVPVLADPLIYAQNLYKPRLVIDVATLGKGVKKATGGGAAGIFSNSQFLWKQFQKAGGITGDRLWRFPLWQYFRKRVINEISYDLSNNGTGQPSSCLAAAALHELVPCLDWVHIDTRGVGMLSESGATPYLTSYRMTGRPTRTIIQFLYQMACPEQDDTE